MGRRGFTLVEILITVLIIGILTTITVVSYGAALARTRDGQRLTDTHTIGNALEQFYLDHKSYPVVSLNPEQILSANFQLDKTSQLYNGASRCTISNSTTDSNFLTPSYLGSIPQDPQKKLSLNGNTGNCSGNSEQGQYLYVAADNNTAPHSYVLMAKMERSMNISDVVPNMPTLFKGQPLAGYITLSLLCDKDTNNSGCLENYYLQPKNNQ